MGLLVEGVWRDDSHDPGRIEGGRFVRRPSPYRNFVTPDGSAGPTGEGGFPAAADRYHLYVSPGCPWAHRTIAFIGASAMTIRTCVYAKNHASSPLYWQQFAPEGVTVEVTPIASSAEIQSGLESGQFDFGLMGAYSTIIARPATAITARSSAWWRARASASSARAGVVEDVGPRAGQEGRRAAARRAGARSSTQMLAKEGLQLGRDVTAVPLGYADHPTALERGDVQAYIGTEPLCTQSVVGGIGVRVPGAYDTLLGDFNTALWASGEDPGGPRRDARGRADAEGRGRVPHARTARTTRTVWKDLLVTQFGYERAGVRGGARATSAPSGGSTRSAQAQFEGAGQTLLEAGRASRRSRTTRRSTPATTGTSDRRDRRPARAGPDPRARPPGRRPPRGPGAPPLRGGLLGVLAPLALLGACGRWSAPAGSSAPGCCPRPATVADGGARLLLRHRDRDARRRRAVRRRRRRPPGGQPRRGARSRGRLAVVVGTPSGCCSACRAWARDLLDPVLNALRAVPAVRLAAAGARLVRASASRRPARSSSSARCGRCSSPSPTASARVPRAHVETARMLGTPRGAAVAAGLPAVARCPRSSPACGCR